MQSNTFGNSPLTLDASRFAKPFKHAKTEVREEDDEDEEKLLQ